ncbi:DoxX family membrane protein [Nocardioides euryhalodurans]|jgi:putative oxidoreductase|uniref:DoxX family protein n=1 Tax=Nocardioides euryhalodurans TaxID=2518370 RepID=A0A4P7GIH7_9ACTN|nr:DoxX family membrane protein [Nocardioides euryhalodurans]QBR91768.1 DoxX family protein [Nocardioides euryhalodurans]
MTISRLLARPMLASTFVVGAVSALRNAEAHAKKAAPITEKLTPLAERAVPQAPIPSEPVTLVRINAAVQIGAALTLATGRAPRLSATVLAASLVPTTAAGHRFWEEEDPAQRTNQKIHFFKNVSMLGGLMLAAVDTEGKPGVAWRARRAARDARREARHLAGTARREARLVAAQVS